MSSFDSLRTLATLGKDEEWHHKTRLKPEWKKGSSGAGLHRSACKVLSDAWAALGDLRIAAPRRSESRQ
ncbi:MAG: hypothetical protein QOF63_4129 [Thermoanaerobaculia bacterium]|jgi:hypothetical protein|nr:hypothetical protein [Thermoanaerobaculia bacterium]